MVSPGEPVNGSTEKIPGQMSVRTGTGVGVAVDVGGKVGVGPPQAIATATRVVKFTESVFTLSTVYLYPQPSPSRWRTS